MNKAFCVFKLRRNILLDGDLKLARLELEAFVGPVREVIETDQFLAQNSDLLVFKGLSSLTSHIREREIKAYYAEILIADLPDLMRSVTFVQHLYCLVDDNEENRVLLNRFERELVSLSYIPLNRKLVLQAIPHYAIVEFSDVVAKASAGTQAVKQNLDGLLDALLSRTNNPNYLKLADKALTAMSTTSHLSHDIHYYKAKFFPRLARSLLNISRKRLNGKQSYRAIDNFVGSGTTLLEASLLGIESVGVDIDPLSVLISGMKLHMTKVDSHLLQSEIERILYRSKHSRILQLPLFNDYQEKYDLLSFPSWFLKNRKVTEEVVSMLQQEIGQIKSIICDVDIRVQDVFRVILSDAISRRIRMRFLGTGVGRFSLTLSRTPLDDIFTRSMTLYAKVAEVFNWLRERLKMSFADAQVIRQDTRNLDGILGTFDILVTSPPYLPAASGRESYTRARMPSLLALDMLTVDEGEELENNVIGAMYAKTARFDLLTRKEQETVNWLLKDELRKIKAVPAAQYFLDMRTTFGEIIRILNPGGIAVIVSGKQSRFYEFKTRDVLHTVPSAELLAEEAQLAGLEVIDLQDIQLQKANANARPRSLDDYYETLIFLKKPQ